MARFGEDNYGTIAGAYAEVGNNGTIRVRNKVVTENLRLDRGIHFSLLGGFESGFGICPGYTTLNGSLILEEGSAVVDSFVNQ